MKEIKAEQITQVVRDLCIEANCHLPKDVQEAITTFHAKPAHAAARQAAPVYLSNDRGQFEHRRVH